MMIACRICRTPTEAPEEYCFGDILYCFGCKRRLEIIRDNIKAVQPREAPTWTIQEEMDLRQSQNYTWESVNQLLEHMQDRDYFVCFREIRKRGST